MNMLGTEYLRMTHARSDLTKTQALLHEALLDLAGALTLYGRYDATSHREYFEYLRDAKRETECAAKALGGRVEWQADAEVSEVAAVIVSTVADAFKRIDEAIEEQGRAA